MFLNLEDETGLVNVICTEGRVETVPHRWRAGAPALRVRGVLETHQGVINLVAGRITRLPISLAGLAANPATSTERRGSPFLGLPLVAYTAQTAHQDAHRADRSRPTGQATANFGRQEGYPATPLLGVRPRDTDMSEPPSPQCCASRAALRRASARSSARTRPGSVRASSRS